MDAGQYEEAIAAFEALGGYRDSVDQLVQAQMYKEAELHAVLERQNAESYAIAEKLLSEGDEFAAAMAFGKIADYKDSFQRSMNLWDSIADHATISAGRYLTLGLKTDGTVISAWDDKYEPYEKYALDHQTDIIAVAAGYSHAVALKADGTVIAIPSRPDYCNVSDWNNIVSIAAGYECTAAIKADGTVVAVGVDDDVLLEMSSWTNIVDIAVDNSLVVGLCADGTVVVAGKGLISNIAEASNFKNILDICIGTNHLAMLKEGGSVFAGFIDSPACNVSNWSNIVQISAGNFHTVGLKSDGTVVAAGRSDPGACNVTDWHDIVAISAGGYHTVGLLSDGTVIATGGRTDAESGRCDVESWTNIKLP